MKRFRDWPLRRKLTVLVLIASAAGLIVAVAAILTNEVRTFGPQAEQNLTTQASSIAFHAAAPIVFHDAEDAAHTLESLKFSQDIVSAAIFLPDGAPFAHYIRAKGTPATLPKQPGEDGIRFVGPHMEAVQPIWHEGERIGTLYLLSDLQELHRHLSRYLELAVFLVVLGMVVAAASSAFMSRLIATPIHDLVDVTQNVSRHQDYTLRAVKRTDDELGVLIDAFNAMLEQILQRDNELQRIQGQLEMRVRERTGELEAINRSLSEEVAARKAAEGRLILARDKAEAANRAKSTFLANMSHDLRTPLTAVIGYSELLEEDTRDQGHPQYAEDLRRIQSAAHHLLSLLSDLLDLSRIEVGRLELVPETIDLGAFMTEFEAMSRPLCDVNGNRFSVTCASQAGSIVTDRTRLRQVLYNLVSNAAKFTKDGLIEIRVAREDGADGQIAFTVRDTGIGMSPEQVGRIFEPFVQANSQIALLYGGSGLGLAICKKCCELMSGSIEVSSEPGAGTTFTARFPGRLSRAAVPA